MKKTRSISSRFKSAIIGISAVLAIGLGALAALMPAPGLQAQGSDTSPTASLRESLEHIKSAESHLQNAREQPSILRSRERFGLSTRGALEDLREAHSELSQFVAATIGLSPQNSNQIFRAFGLLVVLTGAVGYGAYVLIKTNIEHKFNNQSRELFNAIDEHIEFSNRTSYAHAYLQVSIAVWELYELYIDKGQFDELKNLNNSATWLTASGLEKTKNEAFEKHKEDPQWQGWPWKVESVLLNNWVYHRTVQILLTLWDPYDREHYEDEVKEVFQAADECLRRAKDRRARELWFHFQESVAFAYVCLGDKSKRAEAVGLLKEVTKRRRFRKRGFHNAPREWRSDIVKKYTQSEAEVLKWLTRKEEIAAIKSA